jgi:hypothetical protein
LCRFCSQTNTNKPTSPADFGKPLLFAFPNILSIVEAVTRAPSSKRQQQRNLPIELHRNCCGFSWVVGGVRFWVWGWDLEAGENSMRSVAGQRCRRATQTPHQQQHPVVMMMGTSSAAMIGCERVEEKK